VVEKLRDKIKRRMDELQKMMEANIHMVEPEVVTAQIESVSKFWPSLSDEDGDYIHGARYAIEEKMEWSI